MKNEKNIGFDSCPCFDEQNEGTSFMKKCMTKCMSGAKWFLLIPGVILILIFLLGYFLDPEMVRVLWLVITGALIVLGSTFYVLMNIWARGLKAEFKS